MKVTILIVPLMFTCFQFIGSTNTAKCQNKIYGTVVGRKHGEPSYFTVVEKKNVEPIERAEVQVYKNKDIIQCTVTNNKGEYIIEKIETGIYKITVKHPSYQTESKFPIVVPEDSYCPIDFYLRREVRVLNLLLKSTSPFNLRVAYLQKISGQDRGPGPFFKVGLTYIYIPKDALLLNYDALSLNYSVAFSTSFKNNLIYQESIKKNTAVKIISFQLGSEYKVHSFSAGYSVVFNVFYGETFKPFINTSLAIHARTPELLEHFSLGVMAHVYVYKLNAEKFGAISQKLDDYPTLEFFIQVGF